MVFLTDKNITAFSIFAIIFTIIEIIVLAYRINAFTNGIADESWLFFDVGSIILLPIVVIGELIIIAWERNKLLVSYFPYSILLQDVGKHYGIAGDVIDKESNKPVEVPFRVLIRKKGSTGHHYLEKIIFETRHEYSVDYAHEYVVGAKKEDHKKEGDYTNHIFDFESSELKEDQIEADFWVRREDGESIMNNSQVQFKIKVEYRYKLFLRRLVVHEDFKVPSTIFKSS